MGDNSIRWVRTHCARMDHGGCALLVEVKDGKIVRIKGDPEGYLNRGYICRKAFASVDKLYHPQRLRHPLKRKGQRGEGKWIKISWEDALNEIAENLLSIKDRYGARAVAFGVGMPKGLDHFVLIRLANIFGSPNVIASQDVCHAPREITGLHTCGFYPVADFHQKSELVILWGSNITHTNEEGEICSLLLEQIKTGTRLIVIDPRKTALSGRANLFLQIRPGTDCALALAMINVIIGQELYDREFVSEWTHGFEELKEHVKSYTPDKVSEITGIPEELITESAIQYATSKPSAIQWGNPIEHNVYTFDTCRALICLMAICGNLDVPGGNIQALDPPVMRPGRFVRADLLPDKPRQMISAHHGVIPRFMTVPPSFFKRAVLEGIPYEIKAFYSMCTNPLITWAESPVTYRALIALDFFVVSELFMTPTASLADIVLPVATQFEFNDIGHYGLGHGIILARPKVVEPPDECWPDLKILNEIGKRISPPEFWFDDYQDILDELLRPAGITYDEFVKKGYLRGEESFFKFKHKGFKTPTGKVELVLSNADKLGVRALPEYKPVFDDDPEYPLILTSSKSPYYLHSSYRMIERLRNSSPYPVVEINPDTAGEFGISDGDEVIIETIYGKASQVVRITDRIMPGVVCASYGWWFPEDRDSELFSWDKSNYNMLTSGDRVGKEFGTSNLKALKCNMRDVLK